MNKEKGIYIIGNLADNKAYIGSSIDLKSRLNKHKNDLKNNRHGNYKLQKAFNKDNSQIIVEPIPIIDDVSVRELEQKLIDEFISTGKLYNIAVDVSSGMTGRKHTEEALDKMRGRKHSEEAKQKMREYALSIGRKPSELAQENSRKALTGVPLSPERVEALRIKGIEAMKDPAARKHLSDVNIGIKHTPEAIEKMKEICKGRTFTPQAREASLAANIGRKLSDEHIAIIKAANTGLVRSPETRAKISEARRGIAPNMQALQAAWEATRNKIRTPEELEIQRINLDKGRVATSKKVEVNGVVYNSIAQCSRELKIDKNAVARKVNSIDDKFIDWKYA